MSTFVSALVVALWLAPMSLAAGSETTEAQTTGEVSLQNNWAQIAQRMVSDNQANRSGLVKGPFPNLKNARHVEIWKALKKEGKVGDGFGTICDYFGYALVNVSTRANHGICPWFYNPTNHHVWAGTADMGFAFYGGDKAATVTNAVKLVQHLVAVSGYEAFVVNGCDDIPHKRWQQGKHDVSFEKLLLGKGISVHPPVMLNKNEDTVELTGYREWSECNVLVYEPCGGQLVRYEVRCKGGLITGFKTFVLGTRIGDFWEIM